MNKILAFGASSSQNSINKRLANFTANQIDDVEVLLLDLNDFEMPIYSIDKENENGIHELAQKFKQHILEADGIVISFAEHNGAYSAAFKNIYDWVSRIDANVWGNKPMFLLATSPGGRGGKGVLELAISRFSFGNKATIASFSLPSFYQNFSDESGVNDKDLLVEFKRQLQIFKNSL
ncbi:MAG: NADPH-dependent oxidoreductase [Calditrichaeota bacterium]|nr:MAG: NADPH-dependent oxidoreductase [Calditrichota bacterium]